MMTESIKISSACRSTFYLINKRPSFFEGFVGVLNFSKRNNNRFRFYGKYSDDIVDDLSVYSDWTMVGNDLKKVLKVYEKQYGTTNK